MSAKRHSRSLLALVVAVDALAATAIATLAPDRLLDRPVALATLVLLALAVGARSIRVPRLGVHVIAADLFVFCALVALTPAAAPIVAFVSVIGSALSKGESLSIKTAFNLGAVPLSAASGAWVYVLLGGAGQPGEPLPAVLPLLAAALAYGLINVPLTATAVHLGTGRSWRLLVKGSIGLATVSNITCALAASGLLLVVSASGTWAFLLGLVPLIPVEHYIQSYARNVTGVTHAASVVPGRKAEALAGAES